MRLLPFVLATLMVSAFPSAALARASTEDAPASDFISVSAEEAACIGEDVTFTGMVHVTTVRTDSAFRQVMALHHVVGVGAETGDRYRIVGTRKQFFSGERFSIRYTFNIVGGSLGGGVAAAQRASSTSSSL